MNRTASSATAALAALDDSRQAGTPGVTYVFLALCLVITLPTLVHPPLYEVFGGLEPRRHPWQLFTAVLEHGWPGFPGIVHLGLNVVLILWCGPLCERLLGSARFAALSVASMLANAGAQLLVGGVNGSSLVIWAWGPPLFVALAWAKRRDPTVVQTAPWGRIRDVLVLMYAVIVVVMAALPYLAGWRGDPLRALLLGNQYHLVAAVVGALAGWLWRDAIYERLVQLAVEPSGA